MDQMDPDLDRGRLARLLSAVGLAVGAVASLRRGKRVTAAVAGVGAAALGYAVATRGDGETAAADADAAARTAPDGDLRCAVCGAPIVAGQRREPAANGGAVHERCPAPSA